MISVSYTSLTSFSSPLKHDLKMDLYKQEDIPGVDLASYLHSLKVREGDREWIVVDANLSSLGGKQKAPWTCNTSLQIPLMRSHFSVG